MTTTTTAVNTRAFFYVDGIPTKGAWIDLDTITGWEDIANLLAFMYPSSDFDEILCADIEGIARHFYASNCDSFDLTAWLDFKEEMEASDLDAEVIDAYLDNCGVTSVSNIEDAYSGEWNSWEDFAVDMAENCFNIPEEIAPYFDYEAFGRDLSYDYFESNGHFFRNC